MSAILDAALAAGRAALTERDAKLQIAEFGVAVPRGRVVRSLAEVEAAFATLTPPLALKVISPQALHKSEVGGVRLGLETREAVAEAMMAMQSVPGLEGWLLEEMAPPGVELVIGGVRHPRFGPMILVGMGGILVEVMDDVSLRLCPIDRPEADAMLDGLRGRPLLDGVRGRQPVDRGAVVDALLAIGGPDGLLMRHEALVSELDINPLIVGPAGAVAADARIVLAPAEVRRAAPDPPDLRPLLFPQSVAVAGASARTIASGNQFIRNLRVFGFEGTIHPVHPSAASIEGLPAYPSLAELPETVDYAYIAVGAAQCPALLAGAQGKVRFAQVMASGFTADHPDGQTYAALADAARAGGMRLLGPNCMGTQSNRGKLTFMAGADPTVGQISVLAQSGGLSMDLLRRGVQRGLRFNTLVSLGDCADLGATDLLPHFLAEAETRALGLYLEDVAEGRRFFEQLRDAGGAKPVVLLVGGRTVQGSRAAVSHTGALAGDARAWTALESQTGAILTDTLDEAIDALLALQSLSPHTDRATRRVVLFGNGGGASVLAADAFGREGLDVMPLAAETRTVLEALELPDGASVANPIDVPANILQREDGAIARRIVDALFAGGDMDAMVIHVNVPVLMSYSHVDILGNLLAAALAARQRAEGGAHIVLVLRSDGEPEAESRKADFRTQALEAGIPVFNELADAARALAGVGRLEAFRLRAAHGSADLN